MKRFTLSVALLMVISGFTYSNSGMIIQDPNDPSNPSQDSDQQDQNQDAPDPHQDHPSGHRYSPGDGCSSVDPDAKDKTLNGVEKNTVGCTCKRTCENGSTREDISRDEKGIYICRNACHRDRCFCPDPCKN